jgi:hypothetical protein
MAATIQIHEMSGADAGVDKTSGTVRFKAADNATADANNPLVIGGATVYSYTKKLRAYMEAPPNTQVGNLRWYSDGSSAWGAEVALNYKNLGVTWGANYNTAMSGGTSFFTKTSGAPIDGDGTDAGPFVPADDNTYIGDLLELQMSITAAATQGTLAAESCTLAYDEI